jgi:hypothetical protein
MEKHAMKCEEFQLAALDLAAAEQDNPLEQEAREHLRECPHCAAFQRSWLELKTDLHELGAENQNEQTPSRVEMRLRQEFRTKHKTLKGHRNAVIAAWALAAAAVLIATVGWISWRQEKISQLATIKQPVQAGNTSAKDSGKTIVPGGPELGEVLVASNDASDFTLLPASMPGFLGDATVVHVQMQRGALGALGLTVNEEHAGDWIQVDLLLGDDGQPQAVRLPQSSN